MKIKTKEKLRIIDLENRREQILEELDRDAVTMTVEHFESLYSELNHLAHQIAAIKKNRKDFAWKT